MNIDAFGGGTALGGLRTQHEIRLMICYLIANINKEIKRSHIIDALTEGEIANYFEISSAISEMIKDGNIKENDEILTLSDSSFRSTKEIENELPITLREKAVELCTKLIVKETYSKENKVEIKPTKNGFTVECSIMSDEDDEALSFKLYAATSIQAQIIKEKFLDDPVKIYNSVIEAIFE